MHHMDKAGQLLPQCGGQEGVAQQMSPFGRDRATQGASDYTQWVPPGLPEETGDPGD